MARLSVYPGGTSGGFAGPGVTPESRGDHSTTVRAWSAGSARRLVAWLWSVNPDGLARDDGWALTLTVGETPENAAVWHAARKAFQMRLNRDGAELQHWVIEWTAKGRPHMHMAVYGPGDLSRTALMHWLDVCDKNGWPVSARAQHITPITGATGWLQYVSKHASRGVAHYQRLGAPPGWERTGRLWGKSDGWPVESPLVVDLESHEFHRYRRLVLAYQRRRMIRAGVKPYRANRLGHRNGDRDKGAFMGVSGWVPEHISTMLVELAYQAEPRIIYDKEYDT